MKLALLLGALLLAASAEAGAEWKNRRPKPCLYDCIKNAKKAASLKAILDGIPELKKLFTDPKFLDDWGNGATLEDLLKDPASVALVTKVVKYHMLVKPVKYTWDWPKHGKNVTINTKLAPFGGVPGVTLYRDADQDPSVQNAQNDAELNCAPADVKCGLSVMHSIDEVLEPAITPFV
ncbi:beta-Ig-H3 fasciclin [Micractinium conductrix]|uniref:Beta-Ig-H3 fasciclin n=1 Tax=Micractinium conductrix TaxID=554055 RepID=A0A2P6V115_9CHLO|nr:beta-Ig-H3 fasciclin [Micractinium conductrix]|eukprot:PSC67773.1 beta-Ig-H3 fasciclin [Micractinium conductrix]